MMNIAHQREQSSSSAPAPKGAAARLIPSPIGNYLLDALPAGVQSRLFGYLELEALPLGKVVRESGPDHSHVYFPKDAIAASLHIMENGATAATSVIGNDGLIGIEMFMGGGVMPYRTVVESAGVAYRLPAIRIREEFDRHEEFFRLILRYIQARIVQTGRTTVCFRYHCVHQQLCRLLLLFLDRSSGSYLHITQEAISNLLGVRREGITGAARKLQDHGVIQCSRGHINVLDRSGLEAMSCECYAIDRQENERLRPALANYLGCDQRDGQRPSTGASPLSTSCMLAHAVVEA